MNKKEKYGIHSFVRNNHENKKPFIISLFHVNKNFAHKKALIDITFNVAYNELLVINGPSGSGKSTLLKLFYLKESVSKGQILINGINLSRIHKKKLSSFRKNFGIIFQDCKLIPAKTVFENIAIILKIVGKSKQLILQRVNDVLEMVGLEEKKDLFPDSLSFCEQKIIAAARAVVGRPKILIADEPFLGMDCKSADIIANLIKRCHQHGSTVIIATHDKELINKTGGRLIRLDQGQLT